MPDSKDAKNHAALGAKISDPKGDLHSKLPHSLEFFAGILCGERLLCF